VVDTLLDPRALASTKSDLADLIDDTLSSIPGRSVVPNSWWLEKLDAIGQLAEADNGTSQVGDSAARRR
jgi:hypothetical protein